MSAALREIHQHKERDCQEGVGEGLDEFVCPHEGGFGAEQDSGDGHVDEAGQEREAEVEKKAGGGVFDVEAHAYRCGHKADDGFCDSIDADGKPGKRVLQKADERAGQGSGDGIPACNREEDGGDERKVKERREN